MLTSVRQVSDQVWCSPSLGWLHSKPPLSHAWSCWQSSLACAPPASSHRNVISRSQASHCGQIRCVLRWISSQKSQPVFVENRLREIRAGPNFRFRYVPTDQNPADISSRSVRFSQLGPSSLWWHGPPWLSNLPDTYPMMPDLTPATADATLLSSSRDIQAESDTDRHQRSETFFVDYHKFSSLSHLLRVTAWCFRFIAKCRARASSSVAACPCEPLTTTVEITAARLALHRHVQNVHYHQEFILLHRQWMPHPVGKLQLVQDQDGLQLLRCHGRIGAANVPTTPQTQFFQRSPSSPSSSSTMCTAHFFMLGRLKLWRTFGSAIGYLKAEQLFGTFSSSAASVVAGKANRTANQPFLHYLLNKSTVHDPLPM